MRDRTLLWVGCGGCSGETQALLGVEGQASDLLDLIDVDGLRLLWHPSLADRDLRPVHRALLEGREHLTVLCVEGSIALGECLAPHPAAAGGPAAEPVPGGRI